MELSQAEKDHLKRLARLSIKSRFDKNINLQLGLDSDNLRSNCGAFVTIKIKNELRGCIGLIEGVKPLYLTVIEMAQAAAFNDPRFLPLSRSEEDEIDIEISVMTPPREIKNIKEIEVGKHGLIIRQGYNSGLLLPQVATEYNWDRETFLRHTCIKAGLYEDAYKEPSTKILVFSALVF
jgi:AmmeMemoRadiSam system protein A